MMISVRPTRRHAYAFTLIELLLAVGIFAIVLVAINTVFYSALRLRAKTSEALDEALPLTQALSFVRRDLQGAVPPGSIMAPSFKSGTASGTLLAGSILQFCTCTGVINDSVPWGDVRKVTYRLIDPVERTRNAGKDLVRTVSFNLLATATEEPEDQWLMGKVEKLECFCFNGTEWRDSWDTDMGDSGLPSAVRVRILLAEDTPANNRLRQPMELLVLLDAKARTNSTETAGQTL